jgi:AraC-like DNA-binding protein
MRFAKVRRGAAITAWRLKRRNIFKYFEVLFNMTIHEVNTILQISCITLLAIAGIFLLRYARTAVNMWTGISLVCAVICYLVLDTQFVHERKPLFLIAVTGAISIPVLFFLLTKAIFDDHFKPSAAVALWFALEIGVHFWVYLRDVALLPIWAQHLSHLLSEVVSIGFVLGGIYTAIKTRKADLIESRMKFRNVFVMITAALIGITLIVESMPIAKESVDILQILQRSSILGLTLYFLISNFEIRTGFFFREQQKEKPVIIEDGELRKKLELLIDHKRVYRKEGLTIRELAEMMNEQEYKVRRLINGELGFRNFNDFLNKYRVNEACEILNDPAQNRKTILEIAYSLGYQSIGPFNKAFRELKATTPTAYRKTPKS